ncbi:YdhR family protein [Flavobacteriaceae bacterium]|nr:YdhR family protein [Flavobacteriaceae bacterium]
MKELAVIKENTALLIVNYELKDMTLEAHSELGSEVVSNFSPGKIDGLIGKTFIGNVDNGVFGGVYYFENQKSLDTYLNSELWKGIASHPNLINFKTDSYGIASISDLSNGNAAIRNTEKIKAPDGMSVLVVNYELEDMTLEAHAELGSEVVSNFSPGKIDGLIGKTFIGNVENGVFGGVYYFKNQDDLNNYLNSDLWKGIVTHPNLVNFKTDIYEVASISLVSNGVPIL